MVVKKFRQPSVREALSEVRRELGADALVLSTEMVPAGGWRGWIGRREVQVTASAEEPDPVCRPTVTPRRFGNPATDQLRAKLLASGVDKSLTDRVLDAMPAGKHRGATLLELRAALATQLGAISSKEEAFAPVEMFIGPPGVGKTTTIAKIAAQARAAGRAPGLVAADGFRAGAVEQLRVYASIIGAPFRIARNLEELEQAISAGRYSMLVDTAGRSPAEGGVRELRRLISGRRAVRTHLVLAADTSAASTRRILDAYHDITPDRVVITKVDEAESVSPMLGVIRERNLPVSYIAMGQRVPEDLVRATPGLLAGVLLNEPPAALAAVAG